MKAILIALAALACVPASAQEVAYDFQGLDPALTVEPTQVMVLGTTHLSQHRNELSPPDLDVLLERLARFAPDAITIESMPGKICEMVSAYPSEYPGVADSYCHDMSGPRAESGLDAAAGLAAVRATLSGEWNNPSPSDRRKLAAAFLAASDPYSALVQWWHLEPEERRMADGLGESSIALLEKLGSSMNENGQLGARLAVMLGQDRVFPADDHGADSVLTAHGRALWERMGAIWRSEPQFDSSGREEADAALLGGKVLEAYRYYNSPEMQSRAMNGDFRKAMNDNEGQGYGRIYLAWYQTRNLRMVASIVAASSQKPGGRTLAIVGASHKPYFEAYLGVMHDIEVVNTGTVLD